MSRYRSARTLKGAVVISVAVLVCHLVLSMGFAAVRSSKKADPGNAWAGTDIWLITWALGLILAMPLLLWAGMRILNEQNNHLYVIGGSVAWLLGAGYHRSAIEFSPATHLPVPLLVAFMALGAVLSPDLRRSH